MRLYPRFNNNSPKGFTLLEVLVAVSLVGILSSILLPSWLRFLAKQQVTAASGLIRQGIQQAQANSQKENISWQFSIKEVAGTVELATHPKSVSPNLVSVWEDIDSSIRLDAETNFASSGEIYYVRFDEKGNVQYRLGRVTLSSKRFPDIKRCVIVSTLIGATRAAKEQPTAEDGKYCY